jgi:hypothetical protein
MGRSHFKTLRCRCTGRKLSMPRVRISSNPLAHIVQRRLVGRVLQPEESPTFVETYLEMEKLLSIGSVHLIYIVTPLFAHGTVSLQAKCELSESRISVSKTSKYCCPRSTSFLLSIRLSSTLVCLRSAC